MNKEELCKRCVHKQYCKMEKDTCDKCGEKVSEFYPFSFFGCGYGDSCYCKECYEKFRDQEAQDSWKCAISLIKTDKIHCIKCKSVLTHKNLVDYEEDRISLKCQNCKLEFTIWHGEPYDGGYMDYLEEQEGREYSQRVKEWEEKGEKGPRPESPEEGRLRQALISKYGEY